MDSNAGKLVQLLRPPECNGGPAGGISGWKILDIYNRAALATLVGPFQPSHAWLLIKVTITWTCPVSAALKLSNDIFSYSGARVRTTAAPVSRRVCIMSDNVLAGWSVLTEWPQLRLGHSVRTNRQFVHYPIHHTSWWGNRCHKWRSSMKNSDKSSTLTLTSLPKRTGTRWTFVRRDALCRVSSRSWKLLRRYPEIEVLAVTVSTWSGLGFNLPDWRSTLKSHCGTGYGGIKFKSTFHNRSSRYVLINKRNRLKILLPDHSPTPNPNVESHMPMFMQ